MSTGDFIGRLSARLPRHARALGLLAAAVEADDRYRWLELGCSLGSGGGDERSDADAGVGYVDVGSDELADVALTLTSSIGVQVDAIAHTMDGWPDGVVRVAAEFADGVQLDLVMMPAGIRPGLADRSVALVDKDGALTSGWVPDARKPPSTAQAREWLFLAWWALSDVAKYSARGSWHEAVESIGEARRHALRLWAAGAGVPYAGFGLTSLLDFPPFELPDGLDATYASPSDPDAVVRAAWATTQLLDLSAASASQALGSELNSGLAAAVRGRLPAGR